MLMFGLGKITEHFGRRSEKDEPSTFVEQDRLVKQLKQFRARLVNCDDDDFVVRHRANDLDDVLRVFRRKAGSRLVEQINVRHPDHIETNVESFALATAQRLLDRGADHGIAAFAESELDQFRFQSAHSIAPGQMRRTNRSRKLQILADGQMLVERVLLRNVTDVFLELVEVGIKRAAI